jgi:hypothetical protein
MEMKRLEAAWKASNMTENDASLERMRSLIPVNIATLSVDGLMESAKSLGVLYTRDLAHYLKQNKYIYICIYPTIRDETHDTDCSRF